MSSGSYDDYNTFIRCVFNSFYHHRRNISSAESFNNDAFAAFCDSVINVISADTCLGRYDINACRESFRSKGLTVQWFSSEYNSVHIAVTNGSPPWRGKSSRIGRMSFADLAGCMNSFIEEDHHALPSSFLASCCLYCAIDIRGTVRAGVSGTSHCSGKYNWLFAFVK